MFDGLATAPKEENADPRSKLLLRRYFLDRYHGACKIAVRDGHSSARPKVFDACQAGGVLWSTLRREYGVQYWGVDLTEKKGRLKVDSARILAQPGLPFDIIDIDTFGPPWKHWLALLPNLRRPATVFLTIGSKGGVSEIAHETLAWLGLERIMKQVPNSLRWKVATYASDTLLAAPYAYGYRIVEAQESTRSRNARYVGVRLAPAPQPLP